MPVVYIFGVQIFKHSRENLLVLLTYYGLFPLKNIPLQIFKAQAPPFYVTRKLPVLFSPHWIHGAV
jgi:hypothetical protein